MSYDYSKSELRYAVNEPVNIKAKYKVAYTSGLKDYPKRVYSVILYITNNCIYLREAFKTNFMFKIDLKKVSKIKICGINLAYASSIKEYLDNDILSRNLDICYIDEKDCPQTLTLNLTLLKKTEKNNEFVELFNLMKDVIFSDFRTLAVRKAYLDSSIVQVYPYSIVSVLREGIYFVPRTEKADDLFISMSNLISIREITSLTGLGYWMRQKSELELKYYDDYNNISTIMLQLTKSKFAQSKEHRKFISQLEHWGIIVDQGNTGDGPLC